MNCLMFKTYYCNKKVSINLDYITSIYEVDNESTEITMTDGKHYTVCGSYSEILEAIDNKFRRINMYNALRK